MRILYLSQSSQLGGAERSLLDFLASLRLNQPEWSLHLVVPNAGPLVAEAETLKVSTSIVKLPAALGRLGDSGAGGNSGRQVGTAELLARTVRALFSIRSYLGELRSTIAKVAPDLIHANGFKMDILGVWAKPTQLPVVWHIHDYTSSRPVMARLLRLHARSCAGAIANSNSVADDLREVCGDGLRVKTIYNAVNLESFSPLGPIADLDQAAGLAPAPLGTIKIGLVAAMARWKGHEVFLRAISKIPHELPIRAYIIGGRLYQTDGSEYAIDELRDLALRLGVTDRVAFTGFIADSAAAMRALDVVVHASTQPEPFGLVIAEAMALAKPVVVAYAGGVSEVINDGLDALSHPPGQAEILASQIVQLAVHPELRAKLGSAARATAERRFDRMRLGAEVTSAYADLGAVAIR